MFLAAFCILFGLTGLLICGAILMSRIAEALLDLDMDDHGR
jgi:hypothetical protein